jgi:hypothetical protein
VNEAVLDLQNIDSQEKAFLLFRHVILGASFDYNNNFYVKHSSLLEATYISEFNKILESECRAKGLLEEKNKLKVLFENTSWSKEQEGEYQEKLKRIQDLEISKKKLVIPFQIKVAQEILSKEIAALSPLFMEREDAIGLTVESHCNNKNYEYYLRNFFFKDEKLTQPLFSEEEFEDMDIVLMRDYHSYYNDFQNIFSDRNLKKIACAPIVSNSFFLSTSAKDFYGKPICHLTVNQISLYSNYIYFKNISSSADFKSVPQEYYSNLDKVVDYYDQQYSILNSKNNSKKR